MLDHRPFIRCLYVMSTTRGLGRSLIKVDYARNLECITQHITQHRMYYNSAYHYAKFTKVRTMPFYK